MKHFILYNPLAGHGHSDDELAILKGDFALECVMLDVTKPGGYAEALSDLRSDDVITISGGDGTLNKFINNMDIDNIPCDVYYYGSGSGNDFLHDITDGKISEKPVRINKYLKGLPTVFVNGKSYRFINGIGFGIDGYCCERGDELKALGKKVDYTMIAIEGLLFKYKARNAKVTVDGKSFILKNVSIAPTMHGRFYGGGMMPTPKQDRFSGRCSFMGLHSSGKLRTLIMFPSLFKGEHVKHEKYVKILEGREITVEFDKPCALQIDGETVKNVKSYKVKAY